MYKVTADYAPDRQGRRTVPAQNAITYYTEDEQLAKRIAEEYLVPSDTRDRATWIRTSGENELSTWEISLAGSASPSTRVHGKVEEITPLVAMPDIWTADDRRRSLEEVNRD